MNLKELNAEVEAKKKQLEELDSTIKQFELQHEEEMKCREARFRESRNILEAELENIENEDVKSVSERTILDNQLQQLDEEQKELKRTVRKMLKKESELRERIDKLRDQLIEERIKIDECREPKSWFGKVMRVVQPANDGFDEQYLDQLTFSEANVNPNVETVPRPYSPRTTVPSPVRGNVGDVAHEEDQEEEEDDPLAALRVKKTSFFEKAMDILFASPGESLVDNGMLEYEEGKREKETKKNMKSTKGDSRDEQRSHSSKSSTTSRNEKNESNNKYGQGYLPPHLQHDGSMTPRENKSEGKSPLISDSFKEDEEDPLAWMRRKKLDGEAEQQGNGRRRRALESQNKFVFPGSDLNSSLSLSPCKHDDPEDQIPAPSTSTPRNNT
eukprot:GDKJ01058852.1.p1 GENE.GDKJ01058852.1~~GDKJ01058852.1.p1  ORF type:complete len:398 (+),score=88.21 GDKJ01058852.1:38-1195(+)